MSKPSAPAPGLRGDRTAADLRVGDVVVVTLPRSFARARVEITSTRRVGADVVFAYRDLRLGKTGTETTPADARWTKVNR